MKNNINPLQKIAYLWIFALISLLLTDLVGQQGVDDEDIETLDPFQGDEWTDTGYFADRSASATRINVPIRQMAQSVSIFNRQMIDDLGPTKVGDIVRYSANVNGRDERDDGAITVRGFSATTLLDSFIFSPGNESSFPLENIERVELIKGASAVLYGSTPPGGVINMVRKLPEPKQSGKLELEIGQHESFKGVLDVTGPIIKNPDGFNADYRAVLSYWDTESWRPFTNKERLTVNLATNLRFTPDTNLLIRYDYVDYDALENFARPFSTTPNKNTAEILDLPNGFFRGEPDDFKEVQTHVASFEAKHHFGNGWSARWFNAYMNSDNMRRETFITNPVQLESGEFLWDRFTQFIPRDNEDIYSEFNLFGNFFTGPLEHEFLYGIRFRNFRQDRANRRFELLEQDGSREVFDLFNPTYGKLLGDEVLSASRDAEINQKEFGVYFQNTISMLEGRIRLSGGLRWDYQDITNINNIFLNDDDPTNEPFSILTEEKWSPRIGAVVNATENITVYGSFNESFLPSSGGGSFDGKPFDPPTAEQLEFGFKTEFLEDRIRISGAYFELQQTGLTVSDPINPGFQIQTGEITSDGFEFEGRFAVTDNWQLLGGIGYTNARVTDDSDPSNIGNEFRNIPDWTWNVVSRYEFEEGTPLEGLSIALGYNHVGSRPVNNGQPPETVLRVPSYDLLNLTLNYRFKERYHFRLNIDNLTDERHIAFSASNRFVVPGDERWVKGTFSVDF